MLLILPKRLNIFSLLYSMLSHLVRLMNTNTDTHIHTHRMPHIQETKLYSPHFSWPGTTGNKMDLLLFGILDLCSYFAYHNTIQIEIIVNSTAVNMFYFCWAKCITACTFRLLWKNIKFQFKFTYKKYFNIIWIFEISSIDSKLPNNQ